MVELFRMSKGREFQMMGAAQVWIVLFCKSDACSQTCEYCSVTGVDSAVSQTCLWLIVPAACMLIGSDGDSWHIQVTSSQETCPSNQHARQDGVASSVASRHGQSASRWHRQSNRAQTYCKLSLFHLRKLSNSNLADLNNFLCFGWRHNCHVVY